jgi:hypothetical protein
MNDIEGKTDARTDNRIECLRRILEHQYSKCFTLEEASEIGESLISFYEALANDDPDVVDEAEVV